MAKAFLLRIADRSRESIVFENKCYYTNLRRRFAEGDTVFFLMKAEVDSLIGYGIINGIKELRDIADSKEREFCIRNKWYTKIELSEVRRFTRPLPLRLVFPGLHRLGRALHGLELNEIEVKRIFDLEQICEEDPEFWTSYVEMARRDGAP